MLCSQMRPGKLEYQVEEVLQYFDFRTNLLINVCTSMLCLVRESLLENDFASNMKMLQVSLSVMI